MNEKPNHISVCVCTYKRAHLLERLLRKLTDQETDGLFTFSIVVVDNDQLCSAELVVSAFAAQSPVQVLYCSESQQNICLARNKAIANADAQMIAFIDDDEFPAPGWLKCLFLACNRDGIAGVLGPVKSYFDEDAPMWVVRSGFFDRPSHPTGFVMEWQEGRTGNVLFKREILKNGELAFDPSFHRGGDTDFFRRMIGRGSVFIWCDEAVVYEIVPPARWTRTFMLRRALLRGTITLQNPNFGPASVLKSAAAVAVYIPILPFALALGQHKFMNILVRLFDHLGKLMAVVGINPVKNRYITDGC